MGALSYADLRTTLYEKQERQALHAGKHPSIECVRARRRGVRQRVVEAASTNGGDAAPPTPPPHHDASEAHLHIHWFILFRYRAEAVRPSAVAWSVREIAPLRSPPIVVTSLLI